MLRISTESKNYYRGTESDPYMRSFFEDISIRPSCYKCRFKKRYRAGDFTLWDCFFPENLAPMLNDNKGSTNVLIHTEKGNELFKKVASSFRYKEANPDDLVKGTKEMFESVSYNNKRSRFFCDINEMSEKDFWNKYFPSSAKSIFMRCAKSILARTPLYKQVKKRVTKRGSK
jgi:hypothetical protein